MSRTSCSSCSARCLQSVETSSVSIGTPFSSTPHATGIVVSSTSFCFAFHCHSSLAHTTATPIQAQSACKWELRAVYNRHGAPRALIVPVEIFGRHNALEPSINCTSNRLFAHQFVLSSNSCLTNSCKSFRTSTFLQCSRYTLQALQAPCL